MTVQECLAEIEHYMYVHQKVNINSTTKGLLKGLLNSFANDSFYEGKRAGEAFYKDKIKQLLSELSDE